MKIVVLDGYTLNPGDLSWNRLASLGECTIFDRTPFNLIIERIGDAEIVFTNKTPLTKDIINASKNLKYIGVLATGYNVIDTAFARERGITVTNIPDYGTAAVAQYVFALLLELCHHVGYHSDSVVSGRWAINDDFCYWDYPLIELSGKVLGIIGFGRIGQATAKIAVAFGMKVFAYDREIKRELETDDIKYTGLDEVLAHSDIISLHCPLTDESKDIINKKNISKMKDGVFIINTSRGPLINEADLASALKIGKVAGAAVDVLAIEPPKSGSLLIGAPNCIVTPHIAWASFAARKRLMDVVISNLTSFLNGHPVNVVN